jgi:membrane protease YdiL (CAAX protease family)
MKIENLESKEVMNANWLLLHLRHAGGASIMSLLPALYLPVLPKYLLLWPGSINVFQSFLLTITGFFLLLLVIKHGDSLSNEKTRNYKGSSLHAGLHLVLRSVFLISYEWFFRGCVLFSCIYMLGTVPAVVINLTLDAFSHSFNGKKEMCGSIAFGLILCVFTLWCQSVWPAILLHLLLSLSSESFLLYPFFKQSKIFLRKIQG